MLLNAGLEPVLTMHGVLTGLGVKTKTPSEEKKQKNKIKV
jgi:hypothetical protein